MTAPAALEAVIERSARLLAGRLLVLESKLETGEAAWREYREIAGTLALMAPHVTPARRGELLTTAQMAARLGLSSKTLLKHKAAGAIRPALQRGKLLRWRGDERPLPYTGRGPAPR